MSRYNVSFLAVSAGIVLSLLMLGATFPTKVAVSKMIAQESPYVRDQSLILHRLEQIEKKVDQLLRASE